ncbi:MAG TPA: D-2-hydroxyacid dehydrogenase [Acidimicrobiia bacterium]|nr:D-2-hydroxyacid dehydrogenase [Acidimicrobiia bacterium]
MTSVRVASARQHLYREMLEEAGVDVVEEGGEVVFADPRLVDSLDLAGVRWIQSTWAGVDGLDWSRIPEDVPVTAMTGVFGPQIVEFVFGHLLGRTQRIPERYATRRWDETLPSLLRGSTLGVLGTGSIGTAVADAGRAFGMIVRGCRRSMEPHPSFDEMYDTGTIGAFADGLDHLVVVLPATAETARLVDRSVLNRLAVGATLINVGRGATVVTEDVIGAVIDGRVGLAVLDVTDPEPLPSDHPAWTTPGILVTGHTAAHSLPQDVVPAFLANLARFTDGEPLVGQVDRSRGY